MSNVLKKMLNLKKKKKNSDVSLEEQLLADENACYVLITCGNPSADGEMQVEMTYEGDRVLASYLLESALGLMESNLDIS